MEEFESYIKNSFGIPITAQPISQGERTLLPLYLKGSFNFFKGGIEGKSVLWAKVIEEEKATPDWLQTQKIQLGKFFNIPVVFIFDHLDSWQRNRFIEKKVGFVQTSKQVYIPEMLLQLSDIRSRSLQYEGKHKKLSFPAQCAILYHLQISPLDKQPLVEIAKTLKYSTMTVTRIVRELHNYELITVESGKEKLFKFKATGKDLWLHIFPLVRNPIKELWFSYGPPNIKNLYEAGETALAYYSMLAETRLKTFAIGKEQFKSLRSLNALPELNKNQGNYRIEIWNYDPAVVAETNKIDVDKLSLYLSMADSQDERIKASLDELINSIKW